MAPSREEGVGTLALAAWYWKNSPLRGVGARSLLAPKEAVLATTMSIWRGTGEQLIVVKAGRKRSREKYAGKCTQLLANALNF